jgi:hypothetical protein
MRRPANELMRPILPRLVLSAICALPFVLLSPANMFAQDDQPSLGDLAREMRQKKLQSPEQAPPDPSHPIIDNDNLTQVMEDVKNSKPVKQAKTVFSIDPSGNTLKVSSPDVTCSLSFNAKASALLVKPVLVEDLPLPELLKLDGPGSIQDESLQLELFNGTDWELREVTVGLTLERKPGQDAELATRGRLIPAADGGVPPTVERRSDVTLLYHLKADAKPFSTTAFRENIGITPGPDEDWRWSIVEAKGIRPTQVPATIDSSREPLFAMPSLLMPGADEQTSSSGSGKAGSGVPYAPPASDKSPTQKANTDNTASPSPSTPKP